MTFGDSESNGATHMLFVDAGNNRVAVGTDTPDVPFHVSSSSTDIVKLTTESTTVGPNLLFANTDGTLARIASAETNALRIETGTSNTEMVRFTEASGAVFNEDSLDIDFRVESNNNANMLFVNAGNDRVGVGTGSPGAPLQIQTSHTVTDVTAANTNSTLIIGNSGAGDGVYNAIKFGANQQDMYIMSFNDNTQADRRMGFFLGSVAGDAAADERLSILGDGKIGVGTNAPAANLEVLDPTSGNFNGSIHVGGNGSNRRLVLEQSDVLTYKMGGTGTSSITQLVSGGSSGVGIVRTTIDADGTLTHKKGAIFNENGENADFRVEGDSQTHALFVDASTNRVGIHDSAPSYPLDVNGAIHSTTNVIIGDSSSSPGTLTLNDNSTTAYTIAMTGIGTRAFATQGSASSGDYSMTMENLGDGNFNLRVDGQITAGASASPFSDNAITIRGQQDGTAIKFEAGGTHRFDLDCNGTGTDNLSFNNTDGAKLFTIYRASEVVVNEDSSNQVDFRVESDSNTHMLFVDAGNNRVGINKSDPAATLTVKGTIRQHGTDNSGALYQLTDNRAYTATQASTNIFQLDGMANSACEITIIYTDGSYRNGSFIQKLYVACTGSGTTVQSPVITVEDKAKSNNGTFPNYLTWTVTASGANLVFAAVASTNLSGNATIYIRVDSAPNVTNIDIL